MAEVQLEYARRYGGAGDSAPLDPAELCEPLGTFVMGYVEGDPAAMGGWRRRGADAEIKRMYVRPPYQRRGLARAVLACLERSASAARVSRLVLETGLEQPEAIALYRSSGYSDIEPFGFYADSSLSVHLGKSL